MWKVLVSGISFVKLSEYWTKPGGELSDDFSDYLISELGFERNRKRPGLDRAINAFLGQHLLQMRPIQAQAIDLIYEGADTLIISPTASGKTEAAIIPIAAHLQINSDQKALYIAPTRALLNDLFKRLDAPLNSLGLELKIRHGDIPMSEKATSIRVLLTTPESLDVLLSKKFPILSHIGYIILDEIHQIYGNPRGDQLLFLLQRLEGIVGRKIQRIALSATVGDPEAIAHWLCPQREPAKIITAHGRREILGQFYWMSDSKQLRNLISENDSNKILCFANSRRSCDEIFLSLRDLERYQSYIHYSTLSKAQREYVEQGFKNSQMAICVATSTLELGIDIGSIEKVIQIEPSLSVNSFLQRVGRGGRRGSKTEVALISKNSLEFLQNLALLKKSEDCLVESAFDGVPYSILIQQVFSILAGKRSLLIHLDELNEAFGVFNWFNQENSISILQKLVDDNFLRRESPMVFGVGSRLEELIERNDIFTNITGSETGVPVFHEGRVLATLPLKPYQIKQGNVILYAGRFWKITGISDAGIIVRTNQPVNEPIKPSWGRSSNFNISLLLAQGMREILVDRPNFDNHQLDTICKNKLEEFYLRSKELEDNKQAIWVERINNRYLYYTFAGALGNRVLELIFEKNGLSCKQIKGGEGIALSSDTPLNFSLIPKNKEVLNSLLHTNWRFISNYATTGPFFDNLPTPLKRDEVYSRIINHQFLELLSSLSELPVIAHNLQILKD
jgi:ATP-dependent helicase Lhr and Lhr-like helicase